MTGTRIGFGQLPAKTETWEKKVGAHTFVFTKTRGKKDLFSCACKCKGKDVAPNCGFQTTRDLNRDEIEGRPQFSKFIATCNVGG